MVNPVNTALERASWQKHLFGERLSRLQLLKFQADWPLIQTAVRLHRNHGFELVASVTPPWFAWWGRDVRYVFSDYDDSLSFDFADEESFDLEIVWLDLQPYEERLEQATLADWLGERLAALRGMTESPILVVAIGQTGAFHDQLMARIGDLAGVRLADIRPLVGFLGDRLFDDRAAKFSGTRLSDEACLSIARELTCRWAASMLCPRIKAIAVDLDQTLYEGVLGEDGHDVQLTGGHASLHKFLLEMRSEGVFLALVSRNEMEDVQQLFAARKDFPLRLEHFDVTCVSWGSKTEALRQTARELRIGEDALLFVDDNAGELAAVASELPACPLLHVTEDPSLTLRVLEYYPRLWAWEASPSDGLRIADMQAEQQRGRLLQGSPDPHDYLRSLRVRITIEVTPTQQRKRMWELSQKTNQFNLNLSRFSEAAISRMLNSTNHRLVTISLKDRLSDSGLIGLVIGRQNEQTLEILELAISCRALGRRLEDLMIDESVQAILRELPCNKVDFFQTAGPRNGPARQWLTHYRDMDLPTRERLPVEVEVIATNRPDNAI